MGMSFRITYQNKGSELSERAVFQTSQEAITVMFGMHARMGAVIVWLMLCCAHLALWMAVMTLLWVCEVPPGAVSGWLHALLNSTPVATLSAVGLSALSAFGAYLWFLRWLHGWIGKGWLPRFLLK